MDSCRIGSSGTLLFHFDESCCFYCDSHFRRGTRNSNNTDTMRLLFSVSLAILSLFGYLESQENSGK
jgi:hypothetical protein